MPKLHEVLAIEPTKKEESRRVQNETLHNFTKKADMFDGLEKIFEAVAEDHPEDGTKDVKAVADTVYGQLKYLTNKWSDMVDTNLTKEAGNQQAVADVVVGGQTIIKDAPATFLLGMEGRLAELKATLKTIPTLDNSKEWVEDESLPQGIRKSKTPVVRMRTQKVEDFVVVTQATEHHPANVQKVTKDMPIGRTITTQFSGRITSAEKADILDRLTLLQEAFKAARQRANSVEIQPRKAGHNIAKYILGYKSQ